jgi:hypothetical protein
VPAVGIGARRRAGSDDGGDSTYDRRLAPGDVPPPTRHLATPPRPPRDDAESRKPESPVGSGVATPVDGRVVSVEDERGALADLLCAFNALDDGVGYCQGMNFVGAMMLRHMPREVSPCW